MVALDVIVEQALALPESSRALLAEKLFESLEQGDHEEISQEWREEIKRRCEAIDRGEAQLIPMEEVMAAARRHLG